MARRKGGNVIAQVASKEDQETNIIIDYASKKVTVYSNKATILNKLQPLAEELGVKVYAEEIMEKVIKNKKQKVVYSRTYKFPIENMNKLLKMNIFKAV